MSVSVSEDLERKLESAAKAIGITELKDEQRKVVLSFVRGNDVFVSLPTGYGKSVCFAVLPFLFDRIRDRTGSIVLCVSPLTSLMLEQRAKFTVHGLSTDFVGELQQDIEAMSKVREGMVQLLQL